MWCGPDYCSNLWHSSTGTLVGSRVAQWSLAVPVANLCTVQYKQAYHTVATCAYKSFLRVASCGMLVNLCYSCDHCRICTGNTGCEGTTAHGLG